MNESILNKKEEPINQYDKNNERHGYWEVYYTNGNLACGNLAYKGNYSHGREIGYWENYHTNGKLYSKEFYL